MTQRIAALARGAGLGASILIIGIGCQSIDDMVFAPARLRIENAPIELSETSGAVSLELELSEPSEVPVSLAYRGQGLEAQDDCQPADFSVPEGSVTFPSGATRATVDLWILDDDRAEIDERFRLVLEPTDTERGIEPTEIEIRILDDDRTEIIDALDDFNVAPGAGADQSARLQEALDAAGAAGRGVVLLAPGDYQIGGVTLTPGTTLSGRGAHLHRPDAMPQDTITLFARHAGDADSSMTLIEGLSIDGNRDAQGPFRNKELDDAHLISIDAEANQPGRLRVAVEDVNLSQGTASGILIGPNSEATLCRVQAGELWRDAITLRGGGSSLRIQELDATVSEGTTGLWLGGDPTGYGGTRHINVELENARFATGDVEIEAFDGSRVALQGLTMLEPPFRLLAPDSEVKIADSVLYMGLPDGRHNAWRVPHDVEVSTSTVVVAERAVDGDEEEGDRTLSPVSVYWELEGSGVAPPGPHLLRFRECRFEAANDVEPSDTVYAVDSPTEGGSIVIEGSTLGPRFADFFAPGCQDCSLEP